MTDMPSIESIVGPAMAAALEEKNYKTLHDFNHQEEAAVLRVPGMGRKSLKRIKEAMAPHGFFFKGQFALAYLRKLDGFSPFQPSQRLTNILAVPGLQALRLERLVDLWRVDEAALAKAAAAAGHNGCHIGWALEEIREFRRQAEVWYGPPPDDLE